MKRLLIAAVAPLALAATPAFAQDPHAHHQHGAPASAPSAATDPHAGHAPAADPHAGHAAPVDPHAGHAPPPAPAPAATNPHAGHDAPADPHAGHGAAAAVDPHVGHQAPADPHAGHGAGHGSDHVMQTLPAGDAPPPAAPTDHAADRFFPAADMARARALLRQEHGDVRWSKVMLETAEVRPSGDGDVWAWEGEASYGGDINRFVFKTEGEGGGGELESAEVQALYGRAIGPYFNLQAGVRHDFEPGPQRTYATVGVEGLAPYWFEVEGALFLSDKGDLSARLEGSYDLRLTQKLILEPRAEANLAASADPALELGAGLQDIELGLRLRYALRQTFAPYVGVHWERKFGDTADYARAHREDVEDVRVVFGLRAWF